MPINRRSVLAFAIATLALLGAPAFAQPADVLGVPGPIEFEGREFALAWSDSRDGYYIQEYIPAGETLENYGAMFMVETIASGSTVESAAAAQIQMLDQRKAGGDPVVNHQIMRNDQTGEILLDFLVSDTSSNPIVVEWNAYRYVAKGDAVVLYAISRRGYGNDGATAFLQGLKDWRMNTVDALARLEPPEVTLP